jgi:hypothetical protein
MPLETILQTLGQEGLTVFIPFAGADRQTIPLEVHILHLGLQAFLEPEPAAVNNPHHETGSPLHLIEDTEHLLPGKDHR